MATSAVILFHHQSFESLNYGYDNFLNRYGDYVEKWTVYVAISEPCIIYCNLFIMEEKLGTLLWNHLVAYIHVRSAANLSSVILFLLLPYL